MIDKEQIKKLNDLLYTYEEEYDRIENNHWKENGKLLKENKDEKFPYGYDIQKRYKILEKETQTIVSKMSEIKFELKKLEPIIWSEVPDYGNLMTLKDFKENCESGGYVDYDGYGKYATHNSVSNKEIYPSELKNNRILENKLFTHVMWYNR